MEYRVIRTDELSHHGILGQKWGVRRYQNADGTWTDEGKKRYSRGSKEARKIVSARGNLSDSYKQNGYGSKLNGEKWKEYRSIVSNFKDAFPQLKRKLNEANKLTHQMDKMDEFDKEKTWKKVNSIAEDYAREIDTILKPFGNKLDSKDYELIRYDLNEDFWNNLYGYAY